MFQLFMFSPILKFALILNRNKILNKSFNLKSVERFALLYVEKY